MKSKRFLILGLLLVLAFFTVACYFSDILSSDEMIASEVAKAVDEALEKTVAAATYTPYPTYTPIPTYTPVATYTVQPFRPQPYADGNWNWSYGQSGYSSYCNSAKLFGETIPDNTIFSPGETFTKTWTLINTGQCVWNTGYDLVFKNGNSMSGVLSSTIPSDVPPGATVSLSVDMTAPSHPGTYTGYWTIQTDTGYRFGTVWIKIKVH